MRLTGINGQNCRGGRLAAARQQISTLRGRPARWPMTGAILLGTTALGLGGVPAAQAQPVTAVGCSSEALGTAIADASSGSTLSLAPLCIYTLTGSLPAIDSAITIRGNRATIQRSGADSTPDFSLLTVADHGALSITQVTLRNGDGADGGGAIFDGGGGPLTVTASTLAGNSAGTAGTGGAIFADTSALRVGGSVFTDNAADGDEVGLGGAIYADTGLTTIAGSTFDGNLTESRSENGSIGGAVFNDGSAMIVTGSTFTGNAAEGRAINPCVKTTAGTKSMARFMRLARGARLGNVKIDLSIDITAVGGAIASDGPLTVAASRFTGNAAFTEINDSAVTQCGISPAAAEQVRGDGGAIFSLGSATVTSSTYTGNNAFSSDEFSDARSTVSPAASDLAEGDGGAIVSAGELTVTGSRISMNQANGAGGGILSAGTTTLRQSHVLLNRAGQGGGGISNFDDGTVTLAGSTVALNDPDNCEPLHTIAGCFS